jgi:hypothetical protein
MLPRLAGMRAYRELFRTPEFAPLFGAPCAQFAATTPAGLSLATLVYARTDSPLIMFGTSMPSSGGFSFGGMGASGR